MVDNEEFLLARDPSPSSWIRIKTIQLCGYFVCTKIPYHPVETGLRHKYKPTKDVVEMIPHHPVEPGLRHKKSSDIESSEKDPSPSSWNRTEERDSLGQSRMTESSASCRPVISNGWSEWRYLLDGVESGSFLNPRFYLNTRISVTLGLLNPQYCWFMWIWRFKAGTKVQISPFLCFGHAGLLAGITRSTFSWSKTFLESNTAPSLQFALGEPPENH